MLPPPKERFFRLAEASQRCAVTNLGIGEIEDLQLGEIG